MANQTHAEEILQMMTQNRLGPDDTFEFDCDRCGKCCRNREDILFSPKDVFRIAKFLGRTPDEVIDTYCEVYIGENSRVPVVHLLPKPYRKTCPFLPKDGRSIHPAKPNVCAIFPLGRAKTADGKELIYFTQPVGCGFGSVKHTPKEWLAEFGRELQDQDDLSWMTLMHTLTLFFIQNEKMLAESPKTALWESIYLLCYLQYDTRKDFSEQFARNTGILRELLQRLESANAK